ncbi:MAG: endonuclease domain-containing protein [Clostridia bacterium]|nr:endonuclease domain-containing protein [Clostridia bacterium]
MKSFRNGHLTKRAQELRCNATEQEKKLWFVFLRKYPIQFRRQVPMSHYIVDFICTKAKMILELDGSQHYSDTGLAYDRERDAILESLGYSVFRISNYEIDNNFRGVCEWIDRTVNERIQNPPK